MSTYANITLIAYNPDTKAYEERGDVHFSHDGVRDVILESKDFVVIAGHMAKSGWTGYLASMLILARVNDQYSMFEAGIVEEPPANRFILRFGPRGGIQVKSAKRENRYGVI